MTDWRHDDLAKDLALSKANGNRVVFEDIPMGPAGSERPDVYMVSKSFTDPRPTTYEIKVSRSDFKGDVKKGKWRSYLPYSEQIFFACPDGLIQPHEVPAECGLIVKKKKAWRIVKRAPRVEVDVVDFYIMVKLLIATHAGNRCTDGGYRAHLEYRHKAVAHIGEELGSDVRDFVIKNFRTRDDMEQKAARAKEIIDAAHEILDVPRWQGPSAVIGKMKTLVAHNKVLEGRLL